jgi:LAS superfamily LD-carboxypeptidase LdcB
VHVSDVKDDGTAHVLPKRRTLTLQWRGATHTIELVTITAAGHELRAPAAAAFDEMADAAIMDGHDLRARVNTAFRERLFQQRLYDRWAAYEAYQKAWKAWADGGKQGAAPAYVKYAAKAAPPGHSEHEFGDAIDLHREDSPPLDAWLAANAAKYGWKKTAPGEDWHYGFVGKPA